jgi:predicted phage gp36 major capsid-like protein
MDISLPVRDYLDSQLGALRREIDQRFLAIERGVEVAKREQDRRLDGMNEIREQLDTQARTFASRELVEILRGRLDKLENAHGRMLAWAAGAGAVLGLIASWLVTRWGNP